VSTDNSSQSNPNISIQTGGQAPVEPLVIGNANTICRVLCFFGLILIGLAFWIGWYIGDLQSRVMFLEDVVINGVYTITTVK
jgi:hypothetical protein